MEIGNWKIETDPRRTGRAAPATAKRGAARRQALRGERRLLLVHAASTQGRKQTPIERELYFHNCLYTAP